jgi:hypothetical protein
MVVTEDSVLPLGEEEFKVLSEWKQGDFTLDRTLFPVITDTSVDDMEYDLTNSHGWVVISQTCDIVNYGEGKEYVTICPLVEAKDSLLREVHNGTTPAAARLELVPNERLVVDLGRTASIHKKAIVPLARMDGFKDVGLLGVFAEALERRYGRFAFPDWLSTGPLKQLRERAREKHKTGGTIGDVYRAIDQLRVRGNPDLESEGSIIGFHVVIDPEKLRATSRKAILDELTTLAKKFVWPAHVKGETHLFTVMTLDEMSARDYTESHRADLDFISNSRPPATK